MAGGDVCSSESFNEDIAVFSKQVDMGFSRQVQGEGIGLVHWGLSGGHVAWGFQGRLNRKAPFGTFPKGFRDPSRRYIGGFKTGTPGFSKHVHQRFSEPVVPRVVKVGKAMFFGTP